MINANEIAIIAIGRNEGERLRRCLASCAGNGCQVIYVDSNSTDGSAELARSLSVEVVELDMSIPFSAARARNAGFEKIDASVKYVQFLDGDCELVNGWIDRARTELESHSDVAVVCGRRRERFPRSSIYNRLTDMEWDTPIGPAQSCGGDAMMRVDVFRAVGGFNESVVAGEEPELCQRVRKAGGQIIRIDAEMTLHDAAIFHFNQWWKRAVRGGYGALDVATRFGSDGLFAGQVRSARVWTVGWMLALVMATSTGAIIGPVAAFTLAALVVLILPIQMLRMAIKMRSRASRFSDAAAWGVLTMLSKWANLQGQLAYLRDRRNGKTGRLIEYKQDVIEPLPVARA